MPGGKVEKNESAKNAAIRETFQETGYEAESNQLELIGIFRFEFPEIISNYHAFAIRLNHKIDVRINPKEHSAYEWITPDACYNKANLILGLKSILERKYGITPRADNKGVSEC